MINSLPCPLLPCPFHLPRASAVRVGREGGGIVPPLPSPVVCSPGALLYQRARALLRLLFSLASPHQFSTALSLAFPFPLGNDSCSFRRPCLVCLPGRLRHDRYIRCRSPDSTSVQENPRDREEALHSIEREATSNLSSTVSRVSRAGAQREERIIKHRFMHLQQIMKYSDGKSHRWDHRRRERTAKRRHIKKDG